MSTASAIIRIFWNSLIASWYDILCVSLCLVVSTFCYTEIFLTLRHHQHQVQDHIQQPNQTNQLNIARSETSSKGKSHNRTERDSQGVGRDILISKKLFLEPCGPWHPELETSVGDKCKLMWPKATRVGDKCGRQV